MVVIQDGFQNYKMFLETFVDMAVIKARCFEEFRIAFVITNFKISFEERQKQRTTNTVKKSEDYTVKTN